MLKIPFDAEKELQFTRSYKDIVTGPDGVKKVGVIPTLNTPVSIKENYRLMLEEKNPLWMLNFGDRLSFHPIDFPENVARGFVSDLAPFDRLKESGGLDWFGVDWEFMPEAAGTGGSMVKPGNPKVKDLEHWEDYITFPDLDKIDWEGMYERNKDLFDDERPVMTTFFTGFFERLISFVDFEDAALALIDEEQQEDVHRLFDKLADFYVDLITRMKKYFPIDMLMLHDDWGSQRAPFFSLDTCREMLVPYVKRVADACHNMGIWYNAHSCGKNEMLLPAYIEAGVDIWFPQPMNDTVKLLKESEGNSVIGVTLMLPANGTEEDAVKAADDFIEQYKDFRNVMVSPRGPFVKQFNERIYVRTREIYNS